MIVDLSVTGFKFAMNVERTKRVFIQTRPIDGDASSAVLEVKRAFSSGGNTPRVSFPTIKHVGMNGDSILEICCEDTAFLHFEVTTAVADRSIDVQTLRSGDMIGFASSVVVQTEYLGTQERITILDTQKTMMIASVDTPVTTAAIEIKRAVDDTLDAVSFVPAANISMDGQSITDICSPPAGVLYVDCTGVQAGQRVTLWFYVRNALWMEF